MDRRRIVRWMIAAAVFIFACSPVLSPQVISTLDPVTLNTAIAGTAAAAAQGTAVSAPGLQPVPTNAPGQVLDPVMINTVIAQTAAAAGTQTALLIPPTQTASVTPPPTQTPTITPTASPTFIFKVSTWTRTPRPIPSKTPKKSGGGGGGGGGGGSRHRHTYSCNVAFISPPLGTVFAPNQPFQAIWRVVNTADDWPAKSADLVFANGSSFSALPSFDIPQQVRTGETIFTPPVDMITPNIPGTFTATWNLRLGDNLFCNMPLSITVQ